MRQLHGIAIMDGSDRNPIRIAPTFRVVELCDFPPTLPSPSPSKPSPPWGRRQGEGEILRSPPLAGGGN
jgi:hypothetical protein